MTPNDAPCLLLDWDSNFFGRRIARITANPLTPEKMLQALDWSRTNSIDCFYFLCHADDTQSVQLAEQHQFRFVDIRVTLERKIDGSKLANPLEQTRIRPFVPADLPVLKNIARQSHYDTRFYQDPNFPQLQCDALYATWIENSCKGYADIVLVPELEQRVVGYVSCHLHDGAEGQIGLVGLSPDAQGRGIGMQLVNAALDWFAEHSVKRVTVVTQGRNVRAQRLYQKCGFLTLSIELWYHRWFESTGEPKA